MTMNTRRFLLALAILWLFTGHTFALTQNDNLQPLHSVFFRFDSDQLSQADRAAVARLAQTPSPRHGLRLTGYTDDLGPGAYNADLAKRRAEAVRQVLVEAGYPSQLLQIGTRASVSAPGRRAQMRRVDITATDENNANNMPSVKGGHPATGLTSRDTDPLRVGRYSMVAPVASAAQRDPLQTLVRLRFPRAVHSVGEALEHLLARSGWRQVDPANADPSLVTLLALPLPETQRQLGPVPLVDAVQVLCGSAYDVVVDPVHRLLSCEIKPRYAAILGDRP